jgi:hypothetical protein
MLKRVLVSVLGFGLRVNSKGSRLRFASSAPTCELGVVVSFGGRFRCSGHLSHGGRSLAAQDARTATRGGGSWC